MVPASFHFRKISYAQLVLLGLVLLSCTVDASRKLSIAGVSGLGAFTLAAGGAVWSAWLLQPVLPSGLLVVFLPLILFAMDAVGTLLWYRPQRMDGVQLLTVALTFVGTMMLTTREAASTPALAKLLRNALLITSVLPVMIWLAVLKSGVLSDAETNLTRPFALYVLVIVAVALATWREYAWPEPLPGYRSVVRWNWRSLWPLLWVGIIGYVVLLGMSRTALMAIALLVPLSLVYRGSVKSVLAGGLVVVAGVVFFIILVNSYQPLHDRFFKEDAHVQVGGVAINATGRTRIWSLLLNTLGDDWIFGKGVSASEDTINNNIPNIGQPHNDYLRFYYDQGALGELLWFSFIISIVSRTISNIRRSIRNRTPDYPQHLTALLGLTAVSFSMLTDNSYCYAFVMFPLAMMIGCSLGQGHYYQQREIASRPAPEPIHIQPVSRQRRSTRPVAN